MDAGAAQVVGTQRRAGTAAVANWRLRVLFRVLHGALVVACREAAQRERNAALPDGGRPYNSIPAALFFCPRPKPASIGALHVIAFHSVSSLLSRQLQYSS
jgi:hypothetical protein